MMEVIKLALEPVKRKNRQKRKYQRYR